MGTRPKKSIGWGITLPGIKLKTQVIEKIVENQDLDYKEFIDFVHKKLSAKSKKKNLYQYIDIVPQSFDSEFGENVIGNDQNLKNLYQEMITS